MISIQGKGDVYCEFKVNKIRDQGYVTLESVANQGIFFGMTPDGRVTPTVDTGDLNTRFFLEIIDCKYSLPLLATSVVQMSLQMSAVHMGKIGKSYHLEP